MGSIKLAGSYGGESQYYEGTLPDSDSSSCGTFGLIELPVKKLDCIERIGTYICSYVHVVVHYCNFDTVGMVFVHEREW